MTLHGPSPLPLIDPSIRTPSDDDVKIYRVIPRPFGDYTVPPIDVSYETGIIGRLHPINTMVHGEVRQIDYYLSATLASPPTFSDLAVSEEITYHRDTLGFALWRTTEITWFLESGDPHPTTKTLLKIYSPDESMKEGKTRRGNIRATVERKASEYLLATEWDGVSNPQDTLQMGRDWLATHRGSIDDFVEVSSQNIVQEIIDDPTEWLDNVIDANGTTIRDFVISEVDIWGIAP